MALPTNPAWVRSSDFTSYGGDVNKKNYQSVGAIDPLTDVTANDLNRLAEDLSASVNTAPFCVITFTQDDTGTNDPTVNFCYLMTGLSTSNYDGGSPPTGFPSVVRSADADVLVTFLSSYNDAFGTSGDFIATGAVTTPHGTTEAFATPDIASATTVRVQTFNGAGGSELDRKITLEVYT